MLGFDNAVEDILGNLTQPTIVVHLTPVNQRFEEFKQWAIGYVQEHDSLEPHHQTLEQIPNMASADDLEQFLRHNHDYCDECLLKMYRKYAIEGPEGQEAGCGGEEQDDFAGMAPDEIFGAGMATGQEEQEDSSQQSTDQWQQAASACGSVKKQKEEPPPGGG